MAAPDAGASGAALPGDQPRRQLSGPPCGAAAPSRSGRMARGTCSRSGPGMEGTLGKGSFAVVKLGRHRIPKTQVRPGLGGAPEARVREKSCLARGATATGPGETPRPAP